MKRFALSIAACAFFTSGCATINFNRGEAFVVAPMDRSEWHRIGFFGITEFSRPVNTSRACGAGPWSTITTEQGFWQWLVGSMTLHLYTPWRAEYSCVQK